MGGETPRGDRMVYAAVAALAGFAIAFLFTMFSLRFGTDLPTLLVVDASVIVVFALVGWLAGEKALEWLSEWPFKR